MGEAEKPTCINGAFLSARLLWRVVSQTRVLVRSISVLKTDRVVRRQVSFQKISSGRDQRDGNAVQNSRDGNRVMVAGTVKRKKSLWRRPGPKKRLPCYLCRLEHTNCSERPRPHSNVTGLSRKCSIVCLPLCDTHPPTPPLRRSSLPLIRRGSLYLCSNPSPQLPALQISRRDSHYFQYLVSLQSSVESADFKSPIWCLLLQVSHSELPVRHLVLATAMIHQARYVNICVQYRTIVKELHISAYNHCSKAIWLLTERLSNITGTADTVTWELSFMACYLFTELQSMLGNEKGAHVWLRKGFRLLKGALSFYGSDPEGWNLPFTIRETAIAFGRLSFSDIVL